ncbi:hypothetical protein CRUP_012869, partial [Coryphaenoides rupestris]
GEEEEERRREEEEGERGGGGEEEEQRGGDITQKGYEKKRSKLIGPYLPQAPGKGWTAQWVPERRPAVTSGSSSRYHRAGRSGTRDERYRSDVHTEAVQAALAKHKERKMAVPMPSKRRSLVVQTSVDAYTPRSTGGARDTSSGSEGDEVDAEEGEGQEGRVGGGGGGGGASSCQEEGSIVATETWISRALHATSSTTTSSTGSSSSSSTRSGGSGGGGAGSGVGRLAEVPPLRPLPHHHHHHHHHHKTENHSAPPDVTGYTPNSGGPAQGQERALGGDRPLGALGSLGPSTQRQTPKYGNAELMETGDGVPVSSRVSAKIQQLVNTLKRPKRPPLTEFFVDDFEELLEVQHPAPDLPRAEGGPMGVEQGEPLGVATNWPSSLEAGLQRWGTVSPKAPCLTCMDPNGKLLHVLTYGKLWSRSVKVAYNLLHKLGSKQEALVALVFPNNDPAAFMSAFYGCLLAHVVPVPIEVPLSRKDAGSKQVGFLLGSCGVTLALTSDA